MLKLRSLVFASLLLVLPSLSGCEGVQNVEAASECRALGQLNVIEAFDDSAVRSLVQAARRGDLQELTRLSHTADVRSVGACGITPLFAAIGNFSGFQKLLELGADPNTEMSSGVTVVHWVARSSDPRYLEAVLASGGNPNAVRRLTGETPLFYAIGHPDSIKLLIKAGAHLDHRYCTMEPLLSASNGNTPLMVAAGLGDMNTVRILLEAGADTFVTNSNGVSFRQRVAKLEGAYDPSSQSARDLQYVQQWLEQNESVGNVDSTAFECASSGT